MKVGIVGASEKKWTPIQKPQAKVQIKRILIKEIELQINEGEYSNESSPKEIILVSGGCPEGGIDIWAEEIADKLGIKKEIKLPFCTHSRCPRELFHNPKTATLINENHYWIHHYQPRNILIAEASDILYVISPKSETIIPCKHCKIIGHKSNGGCWTMMYFKKHFPEKKGIEIVI